MNADTIQSKIDEAAHKLWNSSSCPVHAILADLVAEAITLAYEDAAHAVCNYTTIAYSLPYSLVVDNALKLAEMRVRALSTKVGK